MGAECYNSQTTKYSFWLIWNIFPGATAKIQDWQFFSTRMLKNILDASS
jgi:hypothetical protein